MIYITSPMVDYLDFVKVFLGRGSREYIHLYLFLTLTQGLRLGLRSKLLDPEH